MVRVHGHASACTRKLHHTLLASSIHALQPGHAPAAVQARFRQLTWPILCMVVLAAHATAASLATKGPALAAADKVALVLAVLGAAHNVGDAVDTGAICVRGAVDRQHEDVPWQVAGDPLVGYILTCGCMVEQATHRGVKCTFLGCCWVSVTCISTQQALQCGRIAVSCCCC